MCLQSAPLREKAYGSVPGPIPERRVIWTPHPLWPPLSPPLLVEVALPQIFVPAEGRDQMSAHLLSLSRAQRKLQGLLSPTEKTSSSSNKGQWM